METEEDVQAYLADIFESGGPALTAIAIGDASRTRGMSKAAGDAGLDRGSLCKSPAPGGNPSFAAAVKLRREDAGFERKTLFIRVAKGRKDRYTMLSEALREYLRTHDADGWLFPGQGNLQTPFNPFGAEGI